MADWIPIAACVDRTIYELHSRNLRVGVFDAAQKGFIGIRTKFGDRFLFTEYHWDNGPPFGTARPLSVLGVLEEPLIRLWERYPGSTCTYCGLPCEFVHDLVDGAPVVPTHGHWRLVDSKSCGIADCRASPQAGATYHPLFRVLADCERELDDSA